MESGKLCIPGERLLKAGDEHVSGFGTYVVHGYIYASLAGFLKISTSHEDKQCRVEIESPSTRRPILLPAVGDVVTCKVIGTFSRHVKCAIQCVRDQPLAHTFSGALRKEDVVEIEKHKVDIFKSFRFGDVVLAKVLGFGDSSSYLLTTAEDALGVVWGRCQEGHKMLPWNDHEIQCTICGSVESRKVAKLPGVTGSPDKS